MRKGAVALTVLLPCTANLVAQKLTSYDVARRDEAGMRHPC